MTRLVLDQATTFPFPERLPLLDPGWMTSTVTSLVQTIAAEARWDSLPILADALQDAGCVDPVVLTHLQTAEHGPTKHKKDRSGGCWCGSCWVIRWLQKKTQRVQARYNGVLDNDGKLVEVEQVEVVNPGDWWGKTWLVGEQWCQWPFYVVVEAEHPSDAENEYIECEWLNSSARLDDNELKDYKDAGGMYTCAFSDSGIAYDSENVSVEGADYHANVGHGTGYAGFQPHECTYVGPGLPYTGISPLDYCNRDTCIVCGGPDGFPNKHTDNSRHIVGFDDLILCSGNECLKAHLYGRNRRKKRN